MGRRTELTSDDGRQSMEARRPHGAAVGGRPVVEGRVAASGAPAEEILDDPHPRMVAGDRISAFLEPSQRHCIDIEERSRQALSWGGNTNARHA